MQTKQDVLQACTVEGMTIKLPGVQLECKLYQEVASALELIGGKWNRKISGFTFNENPTELLEQIAKGQKRNLQKEFQFFPTPAKLADELVEYADINSPDLIVLEGDDIHTTTALCKRCWRNLFSRFSKCAESSLPLCPIFPAKMYVC